MDVGLIVLICNAIIMLVVAAIMIWLLLDRLKRNRKQNREYLPGLREKLAELEHDRWSRWMKYQFSHSRVSFSAKGWTMAKDKVERWQRQMRTAYHDLPEAEKDSGRAEADKMIALLKQEGVL